MARHPEEFLNNSSVSLIALLAVVLLPVMSCRGADTAHSDMIELHRVRANDLDVVLLSDDGTLNRDKDVVTIEFRRGDQLVDVGTVKGAATMPMAGMPSMMGSVFLERTNQPGRYMAETDLSMAGGWTLNLEWDGPVGKGKASLPTTAE